MRKKQSACFSVNRFPMTSKPETIGGYVSLKKEGGTIERKKSINGCAVFSVLAVVVLFFGLVAGTNAAEKNKPETDLTVKLSSCPDYIVPGEPLNNKIKVVAVNKGKKPVEATIEIILSRKKNYVCPVPFAVYCPTYKDYVLLKGGRVLTSLPPGSKEISFKGSNEIPSDTKDGIYYIGAVIDAGNMVAETDEKNNAWFKKVFVTRRNPRYLKPDLVVKSAEVVVSSKFSPGVPIMMFTVTVENKGDGIYAASQKPAEVEVRDSTGKWTGKLPLPSLMPSESVELAIPLMTHDKKASHVERGKTYQFTIRINSDDIVEKTKDNNSYGPISVTIPKLKKKKAQKLLPDLAVNNIVFAKPCVVGVELQNKGPGNIPDDIWETMDGEKARIVLYLFDKKWSDKSIAEVDPTRKLQKPGGKLVYLPGLRIRVKGRIRVVADSSNYIKEANEKNNEKEVTLYCRHKPDLYISMVKILPGKPKVGQKVVLKVRVRNAGNAAAPPTKVAIFVGMEKTPRTFDLPKLRPGRYWTVTRTVFFRRAEKKEMVAIADYGNRVREVNEKNNRKVVYFRVRR